MRLCIIVLLILASFASVDYTFFIRLNEKESYSYRSVASGPTRFDINSTGTVDVSFEHGGFVDRCINTTNCVKEYGNHCREAFKIKITIVSNTNNNEIIISRIEEIGCTWVETNWGWLTFFLVLLGGIICCCVISICSCCCSAYNRTKSNDNSEMIPLVDM